MVIMDPLFTWCRAWARKVGLMPASKSISTPSKPNWDISELMLLAKFVAEDELFTGILVPAPPTEIMTCWPRALAAVMSAINWAWV
jgi:hypothetical protein